MSTPITTFESLPFVLTLDDVVTIYRRGKSTILRDLKNKKFQPPPFEGPPYRWLRTDVQRHFDRLSSLPDRAVAATSRAPRVVAPRRARRKTA